jgi:hypothetical protein
MTSIPGYLPRPSVRVVTLCTVLWRGKTFACCSTESVLTRSMQCQEKLPRRYLLAIEKALGQ